MEHTVRTSRGTLVTLRSYTRGRAIKAFCTECMGWEGHPRGCTCPECPLYPYRGITRATGCASDLRAPARSPGKVRRTPKSGTGTSATS